VSVKGKHVVVTGAGTGIGRAVAQRLVTEGARVSALARQVERLDVGEPHACDVRDRAQVDEVFARLGAVDAVVANAGIGGPNADGPDDRWDDLVATNLSGTYYTLRAAERAGAEDFVVVSSILARIAVPGYAGYSASKAGLLGLVRSLAAELAPRQVNAICPGWVDTDMAWSGLAEVPGGWETARQEVPTGRMTQPEEIASTVLWLLTDARNLTGQAIDHNGGAWVG
jgi:NAD(P)-dependent dehydrogenase (short-subunit alcohol dehydrogenase family)